jgi:hypothetical protein
MSLKRMFTAAVARAGITFEAVLPVSIVVIAFLRSTYAFLTLAACALRFLALASISVLPARSLTSAVVSTTSPLRFTFRNWPDGVSS